MSETHDNSDNHNRGSFWTFLTEHAAAVRGVALILIVGGILLFSSSLPLDRLIGVLREWLSGMGVWGILAFVVLYVVLVLVLVPGWVLTVAGGAVFGLWFGTAAVSVASTSAAALAFLIARYLARHKIENSAKQSPKFKAMDDAIGKGGWKIVAMLRLSPLFPFGVQNYFYGLTAVRFWPYVLASWIAMLPGTFLYVYLGYLGGVGANKTSGSASVWVWVLRIAGLLATVAVTVYVTILAKRALGKKTEVQESDAKKEDRRRSKPSITLAWAVAGVVVLAAGGLALANKKAVTHVVEGLIGVPPSITPQEHYAEKPDGPTFDHAAFDALLKAHVAEGGWVDYEGFKRDSGKLDAYIQSLAAAPLDEFGRNERLALLINAYNAFTLRLILDHYPTKSIMDIPEEQRFAAVRWKVGPNIWSLSQIEHEQIRPKFIEPRVHFAVNCASVGCPPLRQEAYTGAKLDRQLAEQARYVHTSPRWLEMNGETLRLTKLYDWYGGDFEYVTGGPLEFAALYSDPLRTALTSDKQIRIEWIPYDWSLNSQENMKKSQ